MRQAAPISPAVHLGAERILVVGAGRMHEPPGERAPSTEYPNLAQIAGHALSNIFLDALSADVERLRRINATLALLPPRARADTSLKPLEVLVIAPSERLDDIAAKHLSSLPLPIRAMLGGLGVSGRGDDARGAALASYLLSNRPTPANDGPRRRGHEARRDEVLSFFGWAPRRAGLPRRSRPAKAARRRRRNPAAERATGLAATSSPARRRDPPSSCPPPRGAVACLRCRERHRRTWRR